MPTTTVPKLKELAESVTGTLPVPLRLTVCGLVKASSVKVRAPVKLPLVVGVNVTPTLQLPPAATLDPQVFDAMAKPALTAMLAKFSCTLSRFVTVTVLAVLVLPTAHVPKLRLVEDKLTGLVPFPERLTVCVPALSVMVRRPDAEPNAVGVNLTEIVHEAAGARLALHVFV